MLAEAWPIFQERSVAAAQSAYKKVGLFPFKTAEEVKRTTAELLLIQKAGDTVTADDFKAAAAAEREEERREEEAAEAKRREEEEAELSARRDDLRKRQAEEAQAVMARHAAELKAMRERHRREGQALEEAGSTSKGKRKFVSFAGTEAELSDSQKRSRPRHRAGQAAGAAAAPSAEQQAIADHLLAGALTVPEAMEAALEAPAAPGQLFLPAYNASGGEVVMRHTVVASVAKQRGFTAAQEVQRLEEEKAAKAIKGKRRGAKGVINTSRGAVVTAEAIAKLRADDKEAKEKAEASKAARAGRTREKLQKAAADIAEGKLIAERADIVSARAAGDSQALKQILGKLKVDEMRKLITAIDSSKLPKTKLKKDNAEALVSLSYWTQLNQQLADPETLTGALPTLEPQQYESTGIGLAAIRAPCRDLGWTCPRLVARAADQRARGGFQSSHLRTPVLKMLFRHASADLRLGRGALRNESSARWPPSGARRPRACGPDVHSYVDTHAGGLCAQSRASLHWGRPAQAASEPGDLPPYAPPGDEEEDEMDLDEAEALMEFEEGLDGEGE